MISLKIDVKDQITKDLNKKIKQLDKVPKDAFTFFVAHTPIRSGNARARTTLNKDIIHAGYAYAKRLDDGYSPQAPDGMTKPTEAFIQRTVDKIIKGK